MSIAIHVADVSNPTKPWLISLKWGLMVYDEFFHQGDIEAKLSLPIGMLNN